MTMQNPIRTRAGGRAARRALRTAPNFDMLAGLTNALPLTEVMDGAQVERIDAASMDILENVGVVFRDDIALADWRRAGAKVVGDRVYLDRGLVRDLIATADILIENFKVGGLAKYGLDYATLSAEFPGLIYCSITGFGQDGPYAHRAGYDYIIQGMSGLMSITGPAEGEGGGAGGAGGSAPVPSKKDLRSRYTENLALFKEVYGTNDEDVANMVLASTLSEEDRAKFWIVYNPDARGGIDFNNLTGIVNEPKVVGIEFTARYY